MQLSYHFNEMRQNLSITVCNFGNFLLYAFVSIKCNLIASAILEVSTDQR